MLSLSFENIMYQVPLSQVTTQSLVINYLPIEITVSEHMLILML